MMIRDPCRIPPAEADTSGVRPEKGDAAGKSMQRLDTKRIAGVSICEIRVEIPVDQDCHAGSLNRHAQSCGCRLDRLLFRHSLAVGLLQLHVGRMFQVRLGAA
jgi:hypothetical protein